MKLPHARSRVNSALDLGINQSSVLRPSPRAAGTRGGEGLAKLALDCVFTDQSDFTEAIRSNYIHSLRGRVRV